MKIRKNRILEIGLSISGAGQKQTMTDCHTIGWQAGVQACLCLSRFLYNYTEKWKHYTKLIFLLVFLFLYLYYTNFSFIRFKQSKEYSKKFMLFPVHLRNMFWNIWPGQYVSSHRAPEASRWDLPLEWIGNGPILPASCADRKPRL